jgi:hypothetical protein
MRSIVPDAPGRFPVDELRQTTTDALGELLKARVVVERTPALVDPLAQRRDRIVANLDVAIEHAARALAEAKHAPVIPLPLPHVARAA